MIINTVCTGIVLKTMGNNDSIELRAINAVRDYFELSEFITPHLSEADKGIAWDGFLYVYNDPKKDKDHFVGKVDVQSKGKEMKKSFKEKNFSFPIETAHLKTYQRVGTIFFVTQLMGKEKKIFYRLLTPQRITNILRNHKGIKKPSVRMEPLPDDLKQVEAEIVVFMKDCVMQAPTVGRKSLTFDDLQKRNIHKIAFNASDIDRRGRSVMDYLTEKELYLYAVIDDDIQMTWPIGDEPVRISASQTIPCNVSVNGKTYYQEVVNEITQGSIIIRVGNCIELTLPKEGQSKTQQKVEYKHNTTDLDETINEAEFVLAVAENGGFKMDEMMISLQVKGGVIDDYKKMLPAWHELQETLDLMGYRDRFDLSRITEKDDNTLNCLVEMIKYKRPLTLSGAETGVVSIEVAGLNLLLWCAKSKTGEVLMGNYFDKSIQLYYKTGKTTKEPSSPFSYLTVEDWKTIDNIPYDEQTASYASLLGKCKIIERMINNDIVNMFAAYDTLDTNDIKRDVLLRSIGSLIKWVKEQPFTNTMKELADENWQQFELRKKRVLN